MRREHIASPRSPPVRGLATDSGRRSGNRFYGGRSVQKGELEFKPMFNKKNIAKLLVFAMLLTMLPVSTVAAGTETQTQTPISQEVGAYVTVSDAYITGRDATDVAYMTKADTTNGSYKFSADSSTVTPDENQKVTISFKADLGKKDNSKSNSKSEEAAGLKIKYSNKGYLVNRDTNTTPGAKNTGTLYYDESGQSGYTVNGDVYQVRCDITINTTNAKSGSSKNEEATFTLIPIDAKGKELDEKTITLTIPLKEDSGDKNATYAVIKDGVTVNGDPSNSAHKTLNLTKSTDTNSKGTIDNPYKFTSSDTNAYVVAEDSKVEVSFSTENAASVTYSITDDTNTNKWNGTDKPAYNNSTYTITIDTSEIQPTATGKQEVNVYVKVDGDEKAGIESTYNVLTFNVWVGKPVEYTITVAAAQNGTVTTNPVSKATANEEVTITASPNAGYEVDTITVTDASDNSVEVNNSKFTMPASNVTVTVTFKKTGGTPQPEEPDPITEGGYTIAPDAYTKAQKTDVQFKLSATVSYKVDEDTIIGVDAEKITWSVSNDDLTANDYSLSKKYDSDSYKASADVTISKKGEAEITLSFEKPDGNSMSTVFKVTVEPDQGSDEKPYRVRLDVTPKDAGSIAFKDANSAYFAETDTVTVVVTPKDETKYSLNRVTVYKLQGDTDVYADNGTNVDPATGETNTYTFDMPASNVKVIAVFEEVSTDKKVETVKVKSSVAFDDLKEGWALPELTLDTTDGVTALDVKWTDEDGNEVKGAFPSIGTYTFTITPTIASGYTIGADVKYTLNGQPLSGTVSEDGAFTGTLTLDASDKRALGVSYTEDEDRIGDGYLTITGMSALKWYCITETKTDANANNAKATVYVVVKGSDTGSADIPVAPKVSLNIKEMDGRTKDDFDEGYLFIDRQVASPDTDFRVLDPDDDYDMTGVFTEETTVPGDSQPGNLVVSYEENDTLIGDGRLKIAGTSADKWYCITETKTDANANNAKATAYVLVQGSDTGLEIPVAPKISLNIKELKGETKEHFDEGYLFIDRQVAANDTQFETLTGNKPENW